MADHFLAFKVSGLGQAPDPVDALHYGRVLAERSGAVVPDAAEARITQAADGSDSYRVEIPAIFPA